MVDEARIGQLRERASEAMSDLGAAGIVGMAAIRGCARAHESLERLDAKNAKATLDALRATKRELDMIEQAFARGLHKDAFSLAFDRTQSVLEAVTQDLAEVLGEKP
jgi:hypothetical protein